MRSQVMILAHALKKSGLSFSDAIKRAWRTIRMKLQMLVKPISFFYYKEDGSERFAVGFYGAAPEGTKEGKPSPPLVIKYYDTLAIGWRSFRADRLILD